MSWDFLTAVEPQHAYHIEPADKDPASELQRVATFRRELRKALPAARVAAVPNAAKRGAYAARQAKAEGMSKGFPDMMVFYAGRIAFLEWKAGREQPREEQGEWLHYLDMANFDAACVRTWQGAFAFLRSRGWPL